MSHEFSIPGHDRQALAEAYQVLNNAKSDEQLTLHVSGEGPLELSELDPSLMVTEEVQRLTALYGWPSEQEDGHIVPVPQFRDDNHFLQALMRKTTAVNGEAYFLNNFKVWLSEEPNEEKFMDHQGMNRAYGAHPALLRAYAIEPEFMHSLRTAITSLPQGVYYPSIDALESPEGELVATSAHMAYRLLGRLIKVTDKQAHMKLLFGSADGIEEITDAATTLST